MEIPQNGREDADIQYCVGIGASAGGVEALQEFFGNMPADIGASYIVVQHLSPDAISMMDKIIRKISHIPVVLAEEGMRLEPDKIYLNVPGMTLTVRDRMLHLEPAQNRNQLYMPINLMLNSLAAERNVHTIAVILSGSGTDGTIGIGAVKESGGMIIAQNPAEAQYSSMPQSVITTGMVDVIENVGRIGSVIYDYLKNPNIKYIHHETELDNVEVSECYEHILDAVSRYSNIDFSWYKPNTIFRRVERRIAINKFRGMEEYLDFLLSSEEEKELLCHDILIGVTSFFRDEDAFVNLGKSVIFPLLKEQQSLRLWSIACSTGEEAYSLAILACECMDRLHINIDVKIFATDVDSESIAFAQRGIYPESALGNMDEKIVEKYFDRQDKNYIISERIRKTIIFAKHNIFKDAPFSKLDLIVCRNMFIYVKSDMQQRVMGNFYYLLKKGGYLFLGSSESLGDMEEGFEVINKKWKLFQKKEGYVDKKGGIFLLDSMSDSYDSKRNGNISNIHQKIRVTNIFEKVLFSFAGPSVLVDGFGKIVQIIHGGGQYLSIQDGQFDNNISSCFVPGLTILLNHIMSDLKKGNQKALEKEVTGIADYPNEILNIKVNYFDLEEGEFYLIQIHAVDRQGVLEEKTEKEFLDLRELENSRIRMLEKELGESSWKLKIAMEESESRNEELQAANEELLASNEELQSTNEEMQSVNEELYTINAEYQNKIVELTTANNDFDNLLLTAEVGALYIDENMHIRRITPIIYQNTNLQMSDLERLVTHINFMDGYKTFNADVETVSQEGNIIEKEITDSNNVTWLVRIRPYSENIRKGGVLVTMFDITKRLEASKYELKRLTDSVPGGVLRMHYNFDEELIIDYANDSFYTLLQYSGDEVREKYHAKYNRIILPEDWKKFKNILDTLNDTDDIIKTEYRVRRKDGILCWNSIQAVIFRTENRLELQCIIMDISRIKVYEEQIKRERDYYNSLYQNVICGIVQYEKDDNALRCYNANEEALRMLGYGSMEEFREQGRQTFFDFAVGSDTREVAEKLLALQNDGEYADFEHRISTTGGEIRWMRGGAKIIRTPDGKKLIQCTFMDITEEKNVLDQLKSERDQYNRLYNMIYNMAVCGIIQANVSQKKIININREALKILGEKDRDSLAEKMFTDITEEERYASIADIGKLMCQVKQNSGGRKLKTKIVKKNGEIVDIEGSASWIMDEGDGRIVQFTFTNETEKERLKDAEMKLAVATKASEAKSTFLSKMSHEIRTPMNGITGMIDSAMLYIQDKEKVIECLKQMKRSMNHLQQIVNDVLDMSKIESGKINIVEKQFDLKELMTDIIEEFKFFAGERGVGLTLAGNIVHKQVITDPMRLREIVGNLIGNAIKYTEAAGWVVLIVEEKVTGKNKSDYMFRVKDTGCGISEDNQKIIFEAFEQGSKEHNYGKTGSGLGLAICKNLVEILGGELSVSSNEGEGAEFSFILHLETVSAAVRKKTAPPKLNVSFQGMCVLVAEDNELNAEIVQTFLEAYDFKVDITSNGKEALERFKEKPEYYYGLILMDIQMPQMNGYEAVRNIRASGKADAATVPIIAMSANAFSEDVQASLESGMNDHIAKPVDMQTLIYKLNKFLKIKK